MAWTVCLFLIISPLGSAQAGLKNAERQITSAYVFNFCKFVDWPVDPGPLLKIAVLGDSDRAAEFNNIAGKSVRNSTLEIASVDTSLSPDWCQVVFIPADRAEEISAVLDSVAGKPVLTISEAEGFCDLGGMIEMANVRGKLRFSVNLAAADRAGLTISSQLLKMARRVIKVD